MLADTFCEKDALRKRPHLALNLPMACCAASRSETRLDPVYPDDKPQLNY